MAGPRGRDHRANDSRHGLRDRRDHARARRPRPVPLRPRSTAVNVGGESFRRDVGEGIPLLQIRVAGSHSLSKRVVVIGGGVVGLCSAYYLNARGFQVTVLDRDPPEREGCSFGNAGIIVPSHFVPLAAPGMVALGLKCMWNSESPFYLKPRLSLRLFGWIWKFWRAATRRKVNLAAPALRDLHMASRALYEELDRDLAHEFSLEERGLLLLCNTEHTLHEEAKVAEQARQLGLQAKLLDAAATAQQEPNVKMSIVGSVYYPLDCHLTPARLIAALRGRLAS